MASCRQSLKNTPVESRTFHREPQPIFTHYTRTSVSNPTDARVQPPHPWTSINKHTGVQLSQMHYDEIVTRGIDAGISGGFCVPRPHSRRKVRVSLVGAARRVRGTRPARFFPSRVISALAALPGLHGRGVIAQGLVRH